MFGLIECLTGSKLFELTPILGKGSGNCCMGGGGEFFTGFELITSWPLFLAETLFDRAFDLFDSISVFLSSKF